MPIVANYSNQTQKIIFIDEIPLIHKNNEKLRKFFQQHQQTCSWHDFSSSPHYASPNFGNSQCWIIFTNESITNPK